MRKSILIIGAVVLSILNTNATNENKNLNASNEVVEITRNNIAQIFEWKVETDKGTYAGTAFSLRQAKRMMSLASSGEVVKGKEIRSYYVTKSDANKAERRNYFWEVETATGKAKGYSSTEAHAKKMIELVASGDAIVNKIIISQPQQ